MKLKFKQQAFQMEAVKSVVDRFAGQPKSVGQRYTLDPGRAAAGSTVALPGMEEDGFANGKLAIPQTLLFENLQGVQQRHNLPLSPELKKTPVCDVNLDIEMETGKGKTYCYIKSMFELNRDYGWSKFIVVVPSIAIREGVLKSFEIMAEHFPATEARAELEIQQKSAIKRVIRMLRKNDNLFDLSEAGPDWQEVEFSERLLHPSQRRNQHSALGRTRHPAWQRALVARAAPARRKRPPNHHPEHRLSQRPELGCRRHVRPMASGKLLQIHAPTLWPR